MKIFASQALAVVLCFASPQSFAEKSDPSEGACDNVQPNRLAAMCRNAHSKKNSVERIQENIDSLSSVPKGQERRLQAAERSLEKLIEQYAELTGETIPGLTPVCELPVYSQWLNDARVAAADGISQGIISDLPVVTEDFTGYCTVAFEFPQAYADAYVCETAPTFTLSSFSSGVVPRIQYSQGIFDSDSTRVCVARLYPVQGGYDPVDLEACALALGCETY